MWLLALTAKAEVQDARDLSNILSGTFHIAKRLPSTKKKTDNVIVVCM